MSQEERNDLIELRRFLIDAIEEINEQLIAYPPNADDDDFDFLVKKAKSYRDLLPRIEQQLRNEP